MKDKQSRDGFVDETDAVGEAMANESDAPGGASIKLPARIPAQVVSRHDAAIQWPRTRCAEEQRHAAQNTERCTQKGESLALRTSRAWLCV